jgi:hydrogenase expression/formation protein HypC
MGKVSFGGTHRDVCLAYTPEVRVGDYVLVHVGFAISQLDEQEALEIFDYLRQIEALGEAAPDQLISVEGESLEPLATPSEASNSGPREA